MVSKSPDPKPQTLTPDFFVFFQANFDQVSMILNYLTLIRHQGDMGVRDKIRLTEKKLQHLWKRVGLGFGSLGFRA